MSCINLVLISQNDKYLHTQLDFDETITTYLTFLYYVFAHASPFFAFTCIFSRSLVLVFSFGTSEQQNSNATPNIIWPHGGAHFKRCDKPRGLLPSLSIQYNS